MRQPNQSAELSRLISDRLNELRLVWRKAAQSDDVATMHITGHGHAALSEIARWLEAGSPDQLHAIVANPPWNGNEGGADSPVMLLLSLSSTLRDLASAQSQLAETVEITIMSIAAALDSYGRDRVRHLEERIATDSLTGADSREQVLSRLIAESARSVRHGRPLSVVYIDADHLKRVNDEEGHGAGDEVLKSLTSTVRANTRVTDAFGRLGGDEFLLVLPETDLAGARFVARKLTDLLGASGIQVSVGEAGTPANGPDPDALVAAADAAMRAAKSSRGN